MAARLACPQMVARASNAPGALAGAPTGGTFLRQPIMRGFQRRHN